MSDANFATFASDYVVIMSAPNGARRTTAQHAAVPVTPSQLAAAARALLDEQVAVLHMHVRDDDQQHSLDVDRYRAAIAAVEAAVGDALIIQVTTEAVGRFNRQQQMTTVRDLRPEAVSLALRELCPDEAAEVEAAEFFQWLVRERIWAQYILYSAADVRRFESLRVRGFFGEEHPFAMLVLGAYGSGQHGEVIDLDTQLAAAEYSQFPWAVCCFGPNENAAAVHATELGGHVRLGFENNLVLADGSVAADNASLIRQYRQSLDKHGCARAPARAIDIRQHWLENA